MNWGGIMTDKEHFVATLQACYFGDRNAFNEIISIYDNLIEKNKLLEHRLKTSNDFIESRKEHMIKDHYNDLKYIINKCDLESTW